MKKLKCELCGSVDIVKTADNLFECQYCGCKYTLEQARSLLVSGTVTAMQPDFVITAGKLIKYQGSGVDIVIPDNVFEIADDVFSGMTSLRSVILPCGLKNLGERTFSNCSALQEITIPDSVKRIGYGVFSGCSSLHTVNLGNGIESIGGAAFEGCVNLTSIIIPDSVISISVTTNRSYCSSERDVFNNCPNLSQISHPDRFSPSYFRGTKYCEIYEKKLVEAHDKRLILQGVCPLCYHKLTKDNWCRKCKKQY